MGLWSSTRRIRRGHEAPRAQVSRRLGAGARRDGRPRRPGRAAAAGGSRRWRLGSGRRWRPIDRAVHLDHPARDREAQPYPAKAVRAARRGVAALEEGLRRSGPAPRRLGSCRSRCRSPSGATPPPSGRIAVSTVIRPPAGVNLAAFLRTFQKTCFSRTSSARTRGRGRPQPEREVRSASGRFPPAP